MLNGHLLEILWRPPLVLRSGEAIPLLLVRALRNSGPGNWEQHPHQVHHAGAAAVRHPRLGGAQEAPSLPR